MTPDERTARILEIRAALVAIRENPLAPDRPALEREHGELCAAQVDEEAAASRARIAADIARKTEYTRQLLARRQADAAN